MKSGRFVLLSVLPHCFCTVGLGGSAVTKKTSSSLYKAARMSRDLGVLATGDPKKILRRGK